MRASGVVFSLLGLGLLGLGAYTMYSYLDTTSPGGSPRVSINSGGGETVEVTDVNPPRDDPADVLTDDRLEDKTPVPFDPALVDRRPLGEKNAWLVNSSSAVLGLNIPMLRPDHDKDLLTLYPSYAAAAAASKKWGPILASANMIDGKAKQFDDGLVAAVDLALQRGAGNRLAGMVALVRKMHAASGKKSPATPFLAAALEIAGVGAEAGDASAKSGYLERFYGNQNLSKPIGFYTWNDNLATCFRFLRFLQNEFTGADFEIVKALVMVFEQDPSLLAEYRKMLAFDEHLTNPRHGLSVSDLVGKKELTSAQIEATRKELKLNSSTVAILPALTSRETVLFDKLFANGIPADANLMQQLVKRIRSGEVSLKPDPNSGWYDYQVYALETLLLPDQDEAKNKLVLSKSYKKRMLEAFQALLTKRRETHARGLKTSEASMAMPPPRDVKPRLRV